MMTVNEKVNYWLDLADYDLGAAKSMLKSKYYLYVGFMCHQVAEKSLKAVVSSVDDETPPKSHNLTKLAEKARIYSEMSEGQKELLRRLNPLNVEGRYPEYKDALLKRLTHKVCNEIIHETEDLLCWIKKRLSTQPNDTPKK